MHWQFQQTPPIFCMEWRFWGNSWLRGLGSQTLAFFGLEQFWNMFFSPCCAWLSRNCDTPTTHWDATGRVGFLRHVMITRSVTFWLTLEILSWWMMELTQSSKTWIQCTWAGNFSCTGDGAAKLVQKWFPVLVVPRVLSGSGLSWRSFQNQWGSSLAWRSFQNQWKCLQSGKRRKIVFCQGGDWLIQQRAKSAETSCPKLTSHMKGLPVLWKMLLCGWKREKQAHQVCQTWRQNFLSRTGFIDQLIPELCVSWWQKLLPNIQPVSFIKCGRQAWNGGWFLPSSVIWEQVPQCTLDTNHRENPSNFHSPVQLPHSASIWFQPVRSRARNKCLGDPPVQ